MKTKALSYIVLISLILPVSVSADVESDLRDCLKSEFDNTAACNRLGPMIYMFESFVKRLVKHDADVLYIKVQEGTLEDNKFDPSNSFEIGETVYARIPQKNWASKLWCFLFEGESTDIYIVENNPTKKWHEGDTIPDPVTPKISVEVDSLCSSNGVMVWGAPLKGGDYDLVVDIDEDKTFKHLEGDVVDNRFKTFGFEVLPEAATAALLGLGLFAMIGYFGIYGKRN